MFSRSSYHRMIISRVVPELAEVDCYKAKAIIDDASKRLPFKDSRNWLLILASIAFSLPFVLLVFLGDLPSKVGLSSWMEFFIFLLVILPLVILVDAVHLRIVRPEILSLLAE